MNYKYLFALGIFATSVSIILIILSIPLELPILLIIGIILLVVSVIFTISVPLIEMFSKDKVLDIEELKKQGLTVIKCSNCMRINVKEDIYCIYCGEKLDPDVQQL